MLIRLQKYLADCGVSSRRRSEQLILNGEITLNGKTVKEVGIKIDPEKDEIFYKNQKVIRKKSFTYIMLHKPEGYITSVRDQFNRKTVIDLIKLPNLRVFPVGRLDYDTSGLIILTDDGDLTFKLTHPKHNIEKKYIAKVKGIPTSEELDNFKKGLYIEDYKTSPAKIKIINRTEKTSLLEIIIKEGRNRQVRKMCAKINHPVISLKRISTGKLELGNLKKGEYRLLTEDEIIYLKNENK